MTSTGVHCNGIDTLILWMHKPTPNLEQKKNINTKPLKNKLLDFSLEVNTQYRDNNKLNKR